MANLNPVETTVSMAGEACFFTRLSLHQAFNAHHTFQIEVDFEEFGGKWMEDPTKLINMIGKDVNITMKHRESGEESLFAGIITNVSMAGRHGQQNTVIISGCSPTIKLAGKPTMDSFVDLPLQQIVNEAVGNSGNGCAVTANPVFGSTLDYICQYNESCFDFLNRLSWEFGEWFFYDGLDCYFGKKKGESTTLEYDKEMTHFDLSANLIPGKFSRYHYLINDDKEIDKDDPGSIPGVRGYLEVSKNRSESIYTSDSNTPLLSPIKTKKDLDDLVKAEKSRTVGQMLIMRGRTQTCKVKIGGSVSVRLPKTMDVSVKSVDTFLITQITHEIDQAGRYSNSFEGIIDGIEAIPMEEPFSPTTGPQVAIVKDNADSKGRIKVEFQWQKKVGKTTNWIRVQTPDAGKSDKVGTNRGLVTIPEVGDMVMVGFEYGDPDRPFSMGSIFTSKAGGGGGSGNKTKSLTTRSGATVILDDDQGKGSITIKEPSGNTVIMDGAGNVTITAPNTLTINATDLNMNASNSINVSAKPSENGGEGTIAVMAEKTYSLTTETEGISIQAKAKEVSIEAQTELSATSQTSSLSLQAATEAKIDGQDIAIEGASTVRISSSDTDIM